MNNTNHENAIPSSSLPAENRGEEVETFGAAGPILVFIFVLWGLTMAAAATAIP
ncbi:MAG: hypothetical protein H6851_02955 [Geminicoccaceae bacterium]|nr:hypothetical protein [Geminicoccaceae bacterium]MCB9942573.1 hypothetical protein [Geminicoccaceae bacterium]